MRPRSGSGRHACVCSPRRPSSFRTWTRVRKSHPRGPHCSYSRSITQPTLRRRRHHRHGHTGSPCQVSWCKPARPRPFPHPRHPWLRPRRGPSGPRLGSSYRWCSGCSRNGRCRSRSARDGSARSGLAWVLSRRSSGGQSFRSACRRSRRRGLWSFGRTRPPSSDTPVLPCPSFHLLPDPLYLTRYYCSRLERITRVLPRPHPFPSRSDYRVVYLWSIPLRHYYTHPEVRYYLRTNNLPTCIPVQRVGSDFTPNPILKVPYVINPRPKKVPSRHDPPCFECLPPRILFLSVDITPDLCSGRDKLCSRGSREKSPRPGFLPVTPLFRVDGQEWFPLTDSTEGPSTPIPFFYCHMTLFPDRERLGAKFQKFYSSDRPPSRLGPPSVVHPCLCSPSTSFLHLLLRGFIISSNAHTEIHELLF